MTTISHEKKSALYPRSAALPEDFVYLDEIDKSILIDIRYAGTNNFIGRVIDGYFANRAVLRLDVALALQRVQRDLIKQDLCLRVFECYRPQRATELFYRWAQDLSDQTCKQSYYPDIDKRDIFDLGYISLTSHHCCGIAVDLTICKKQGTEFAEFDMGTIFDFFSDDSHTLNNKNISSQAFANRMFLKNVMEEYGFENYEKEWWHFALSSLMHETQSFDFPLI